MNCGFHCCRALRTGEWKIGEERFTAAGQHHVEMGGSHELLKMRELRILRQKIIAIRSEPQIPELRVVDEDPRSARSIRAVFQILLASIEEQSGPVGIKNHR